MEGLSSPGPTLEGPETASFAVCASRTGSKRVVRAGGEGSRGSYTFEPESRNVYVEGSEERGGEGARHPMGESIGWNRAGSGADPDPGGVGKELDACCKEAIGENEDAPS